MTSHHDHLWSVCKSLDADYLPYGSAERLGADCSGGCVFYYKLDDRLDESISNDWGVCTNPRSHRCGLLTFEHQGCGHFQGHATAGGAKRRR
jgi:hypothetical protein